jgi:surfeit locus 1 family protein
VSAERVRKSTFLPVASAIIGIAVLLGLGTWQVERKAWKEALIDTLTRRASDAPVALPPPAEWARMTPESWEFRRVRLRVEPMGQPDALLYTGGSALRDDVKAPGYFVFAPARLPDRNVVVVNRGYVTGKTYARTGAQEIVGAMRWPEEPSWFIAAHDAAGDVWHARDHRAMAAFKGWGEVAPFYIEQEAPVPAEGAPHPAPLQVRLRNDHLQYALTWYALAVVLAAISALWAVRRRREPPG